MPGRALTGPSRRGSLAPLRHIIAHARTTAGAMQRFWRPGSAATAGGGGVQGGQGRPRCARRRRHRRGRTVGARLQCVCRRRRRENDRRKRRGPPRQPRRPRVVAQEWPLPCAPGPSTSLSTRLIDAQALTATCIVRRASDRCLTSTPRLRRQVAE